MQELTFLIPLETQWANFSQLEETRTNQQLSVLVQGQSLVLIDTKIFNGGFDR